MPGHCTTRERAERLREILASCTGHVVTAAALAEKLGVTERTIYRYVDILREEGHDVRGEPGVGFLLRQRYPVEKIVEAISMLRWAFEGCGIKGEPSGIVVDKFTIRELSVIIEKTWGMPMKNDGPPLFRLAGVDLVEKDA